jgi:hypothetical protein
MPFCSDLAERIFACLHLRTACQLAVLNGIAPVKKQASRLGALVPCFSQAYLRVRSKRDRCFLAVGLPVAEAPELGTGWLDLEVQAMTLKKLYKLGARLGTLDLHVAERLGQLGHTTSYRLVRT